MAMITKVTIEIEFHTSSTDPEELEEAARDFIDYLSEKDNVLPPAPYYWDFSDWRFEQVEEK